MAQTFSFEEAFQPAPAEKTFSFDSALKSEGVTGRLADVARSIYTQESGAGKNTRTSNAGAVGGMQIVPPTFASVADKGWDINDPEHNARAGIRYLKQLDQQSGGNPELTAAGYYGGPGGLEKARKGIAVGDPRNPSAPNTLQYGQQVAARLPKSAVVQALDKATDLILPSANAAEAVPRATDKPPVTFSFEEAMGTGNAPAAPTEPKRSMLDELGRQLGLTVRAGVNGIAALPAMASDAITAPINAGLDAVQGPGQGFRFKSAAKSVDDLMTAAGVTKPENAQERVVQDVAGAMAGTGGMVKGGLGLAKYAGGPTAKGVGGLLAAGPGLQLASASAGAGASGVTREAGGGQGAQLAAGLAAGLAPGFGAPAAQSLARGALRGGEAGRQKIAKSLETFEAAGVNPTLGQVAGGKLQRVESILGKAPGGAGIIANYADKQASDMAVSVQRLSDELAPGANAMNAGEAITRGFNSFKDGIKAVQQKLYANLDTYIPAGTPITSDRTRAALADLNSDIAGAPELSKWFKNARIQGIESGLKTDTTSIDAVLSRPGMKQQIAQMQAQLEADAARATAANAERRMLNMSNLEPVMTPAQIKKQVDGFLTKQVDNRLPYESIKKLRTLVGRELADSSLAADVPRSKWTALYAALSDDLGVAAKNAGPEAEKSWNWANQYTNGQLGRLEQLSSIVAKDSPEKIFGAATAGTLEGDTIIRRVISALPKQERREVAAAVLQRLGRATAGQQNAMGDAFSSETFLTNLSKLSPASRRTLFGRTDVKGIEAQVEQFAKVSDMRRAGGKVFANPSGTATTGAQLVNSAAIGSGITASVASGSPLPLLGALAGPAIANVGARILTSPSIVKFAAGKSVLREGAKATAVNAASRINNTQEPTPPATFSFEEAMSSAPPAQEAPQSTSVNLSGMAQSAADAAGDAEQEAAPDTAPAPEEPPAFTAAPQRDGTLSMLGDPAALRETLLAAGIPARSIMSSGKGITIGKTQAARVQQAIDAMQMPSPANVDDNQTSQFAAGAPGLDAPVQAATNGDFNEQNASAAAADQTGSAAQTAPVEAVAAAGAAGDGQAATSAAPGASQMASVRVDSPTEHPDLTRIQRLTDAGEKHAAEIYQAKYDRAQASEAATTELAGMRDASPDMPLHADGQFQQIYQQQRVAGVKPAEAAAKAGMLAQIMAAAPSIGMPTKAIAMLQEQAEKMPISEVPALTQRFAKALVAKGVMQPFDGMENLADALAQARDDAMHMAVSSVYSKAPPPSDVAPAAAPEVTAAAVPEAPLPVAQAARDYSYLWT